MFELTKSKMITDTEIENESVEISVEELIGAQIIATTPFKSSTSKKEDPEELDEIEIRLKDGRYLNICSSEGYFVLVEWADHQDELNGNDNTGGNLK
jgi:hypothetical protein